MRQTKSLLGAVGAVPTFVYVTFCVTSCCEQQFGYTSHPGSAFCYLANSINHLGSLTVVVFKDDGALVGSSKRGRTDTANDMKTLKGVDRKIIDKHGPYLAPEL